jgi:hypothetical protein
MTELEAKQAEEIKKLRRLLAYANSRLSKQRARAEMWRLRWHQDRKR